MDDLLVVRMATTTVPAHPHSVLMLTKLEWQMHLVLQEEVAPAVATLEVDLVVIPITHTHAMETETVKSPRHSP